MKKYIVFNTVSILLICILLSLPASAEWKRAFENDMIGFTCPEGWEVSDVRDEVNTTLTSFDDEMLFRPIEVLPEERDSGLMIVASARDDDKSMLIDYILMSQGKDAEVYALYEGETEFPSAGDSGIEAWLSIYALDDGESEMLICHDIYFFEDKVRYEFLYIVPAGLYASAFDDVEMIFSSLEFL